MDVRCGAHALQVLGAQGHAHGVGLEFGDVQQPGLLLVVWCHISDALEHHSVRAVLPYDLRAWLQVLKSHICDPPHSGEISRVNSCAIGHLLVAGVSEVHGAIAVFEPVPFAQVHVPR